MNKKILCFLFSLTLCSAGLQASSITFNVISASLLDEHQWQAVNNLWCASFYEAYKDLPFDQVDCDIKDASTKALVDYLQRLFDKGRSIAIKDSSSLVLAYSDKQLVGYTLYHMLEQQAIMHINHVAIDPSCQGQGIGKKLLEATIQSKPEIIAVVLTTRILNKQARGFYRKQGFYELSSIDDLEFDPRYSVLLRKDIKIS